MNEEERNIRNHRINKDFEMHNHRLKLSHIKVATCDISDRYKKIDFHFNGISNLHIFLSSIENTNDFHTNELNLPLIKWIRKNYQYNEKGLVESKFSILDF